MKRLLIPALLLFFCCGCSIQYDLTLNYDQTIDEEISIIEQNTNIEKIYGNPKDYILNYVKIYEESDKYSQYKFKKIFNKKTSEVKITKNNIDFLEYANTTIARQSLFNEITLKKDETNQNIFTLKATGNKGDSFFFTSDSIDDLAPSKVVFRIKTLFPVLETNADKKDFIQGIYEWHFDSNTKEKEVVLKINTEKTIMATITYWLKKYMILIIIGAALLIIGLIFYIINKHNNKL